MSDVLVTVSGLRKTYQALRPLRIESLTLQRAGTVSVMGFDAAAAEMLVGLLTGAVLPDEGEVQLFGKSTRHVPDSEAWLEMLDDIGLFTDRAVLIAQFTVEQNIAMPFTLQIDPISEAVRPQVARLAREVGLADVQLPRQVAQASADLVARVRLARALALDPIVLVLEHPTATLARDQVKGFATDIARVARDRQLSVLAITADEAFASALGGEVLTHEPATGVLKPRSTWRKIFG